MSNGQVALRKTQHVVARKFEGELLLVPIRRSASQLNSIYSGNEVAASIWQLIDGQRTEAEICSGIVREYDVDAQQAAQDVAEFLTALRGLGALEQT